MVFIVKGRPAHGVRRIQWAAQSRGRVTEQSLACGSQVALIAPPEETVLGAAPARVTAGVYELITAVPEMEPAGWVGTLIEDEERLCTGPSNASGT